MSVLTDMSDRVSTQTPFGPAYGSIAAIADALPDEHLALNVRAAVYRLGESLLSANNTSAQCDITEAVAEARDLREFSPRRYAAATPLINSLTALRAALTE